MGSVTSPYGSASRLRVYARRICLSDPLHAYPRTTNAWDHLPSCVPPSLTAIARSGSAEASPLRNDLGIGADTVVREYQPVVHRLRPSASP
jgi:hypothetical protein